VEVDKTTINNNNNNLEQNHFQHSLIP